MRAATLHMTERLGNITVTLHSSFLQVFPHFIYHLRGVSGVVAWWARCGGAVEDVWSHLLGAWSSFQ